MTEKKKIVTVIGTRPEVIKTAPVINELNRRRDLFRSIVVITGQHVEMCRPYLDLFSVTPEHNLAIMQADQTLDSIVAAIMTKMPAVLREIRPDMVLVQGDTTTAFATALAAFHNNIRIGHIEAGLRTHNKLNPFPEEINRRLVGCLADFHFAPTDRARDNLLAEGTASERVFVTGNTVIDALLGIVRDDYRFSGPELRHIDFSAKKVICVTTHRRESFGAPLLNTIDALKKINELFTDTEIILPVHYNPNVKKHIYAQLDGRERIHLIDPLPYEPFAQLLNKCHLILTDSGGIQEEAPSLGKPVLVLRETTERPEGIEAGTARLVGTDVETILEGVTELLTDREAYNAMAQAKNPYGDGRAAARIVDILARA